MIESGIKTEEYRDIKPYYKNRLNGLNNYKYVCFHKGYTATTMTFEIESISIGKGKPEWGAPKEDVFIIKLGKRLPRKEVSREA